MIEPAQAGAMVFHPGELIADELIERGLTPKVLLCRGWTRKRVNLLLQGKKRINYAMASHIRDMWGTSTELWFNLQVTWDAYPDRQEMPPWPRKFS